MAALVVLASLSRSLQAAEPPVDFGRDVLPILSDRCFLCHGPDGGTRKAQLRLDRKDDALRAEEPVIVPGHSDQSEVVARVASTDPDEVMPPPKHGKPLSPAQVETLRRWIDAGAPWGGHWAFERVRDQAIPSVSDPSWPRNPIDRFVLARLDVENLTPSPEAEPATLLRRLRLDLTGLPPTPDEVDAVPALLATPGGYERLVDRLLASPAFGERMAWDWLDAARYADSNGYQGDANRTMWPWRDWVVDAFNQDLPYDQFTTWQLAGDLLPNASRSQVLATAFCRNHMINGEGGRIPEENRVDYVMDMTETTATVWLGLTFNCCRCHDHKFDPITQRDYYGLFALFNQTPVDGGGGDPQARPNLDVPTADQAARGTTLSRRHEQAAAALDALEASLFPRPAGKPAAESDAARAAKLGPKAMEALGRPAFRRGREHVEALQKEATTVSPDYAAKLADLRAAMEASENLIRSIPRVMVMADRPERRDTFILARGSYEKPTTKVDPSLPAVVAGSAPTPSNRLDLARWLTSPDNPLTPRVVVNRLWQQFFGAGLVKTPEDFGVQGEPPSHPELLDWLAGELVRSGWHTKALIRLIVTSTTYRQSSRVSPALLERDPQNRLLARGARFRLPSWMIRDQALAASGLLATRIGGAPVRPYQPDGVWEEATFGAIRYAPDAGEALYRRSLYTFWRRIVGPTLFFDSAPRQTCVVKPTRTNSPMHALTTLNDATYVEAARVLAGRALTDTGPTPAARIAWMTRRLLARDPSDRELTVLAAGHDRVRAGFAADRAAAEKYLAVGASPRDPRLDPVEHAALAAVGLALLNLDEALTRE